MSLAAGMFEPGWSFGKILPSQASAQYELFDFSLGNYDNYTRIGIPKSTLLRNAQPVLRKNARPPGQRASLRDPSPMK